MSDTTENTNLVWWSLPWWTCLAIIVGLFLLNIQLYMFRKESSSGWFHIEAELRGIQVDAELQRERDRYHEQHPGDRRIPGDASGWTPLGQPQPPLTEPENEDEESP